MLKHLPKLMLCNLAALLIFVANSGVTAGCFFLPYEPDIPECLRK
jgi:cyclic lactone autoinducer peptide